MKTIGPPIENMCRPSVLSVQYMYHLQSLFTKLILVACTGNDIVPVTLRLVGNHLAPEDTDTFYKSIRLVGNHLAPRIQIRLVGNHLAPEDTDAVGGESFGTRLVYRHSHISRFWSDALAVTEHHSQCILPPRFVAQAYSRPTRNYSNYIEPCKLILERKPQRERSKF